MNRLLLPVAFAIMLVEPALTPPEHMVPARPPVSSPVYHAPAPAPEPVYHQPQAPAYHQAQAPAYHQPQAPVYHQPQSRAYGPSPVIGVSTTPARISNPFRWRRWSWNRGVVWYPIPYYWGGGFWGPWGLLATPIDYGSVPFDVAPESPGAQLLEDYGLTQTQCGQPDLVVIWGPGNAPICAYPNGLVGPGNYEVDPETLTLHAR